MPSRQNVQNKLLASHLIVSLAIALQLNPPLARSADPQHLVLFTRQEARQLHLTAREWHAVAVPRGLSMGPQIIIRRPKFVPSEIPTIETKSPTDLDVTFQPHGAPIKMDSLDVTASRGFFSKSLTEMLRPYIRGDSIEISQVEIPTGRFLLNISIADTSGNVTDTVYRLEVGGE
jgi:hypothetical protein